MPSFKPKAVKKVKVCKKYTSSLDYKHQEFVNEFARNELETIPGLKEERYSLKMQLKMEPELTIDQRMEIKDRIEEINETIKELKNKKIDYYLDNSKYIHEFFQEKKNINNVSETSNKPLTTKNQALFNMFKIKKEEPLVTEEMSEDLNKNTIVQKYLINIDESFLDMNLYVRETDICQSCKKGELIPMEDEGVLLCNVCAINVPYLIENEKPSYKEPPKEVCFYAYRKINHFKEIVAQFQGKETTNIPDEVIFQIQNQIKKERITLTELTHHKTKEILKKLQYNKYYEHISFIKNKLGIKPPLFTPELEEILFNLFMEIQAPYAKIRPDYRVNFLNYHYTLYKLCELLDETQYLHEIPMLKDREKIIEQDDVWRQICVELDWVFIPTQL